MISRFWTAFLLSLACASTIAWLLALMHEKNIRPVQDIVAFLKKQSKAGRVIFGSFFITMWIFASVKPNGGGNGGNLRGPVPMGEITITSTNTTRTITGDDFRRGFVMSRVGTDGAFDFTPPAGATVCSDWRAFGAASDWIYESVNWTVESGKWGTGSGEQGTGNGEQGTGGQTRLRIHSDGWAEVKDGPVFSPFKAVLGIVPEANWNQMGNGEQGTGNGGESQFWHFVTPSNTLQVTWQNALYGRDTNTPVSVQAEFWTDGRFTYRYDLSRCGGRGTTALPEGVITNITIVASFAGNDWTTNAIPTNVTSMTFYPLSEEDAYDQDPDRDGLATIDELFVYHTDPRHPDSDYDGLTDYEELFTYHTDPLDPYSAGGPYCDGLAVRLGDADPFSYPEGSTNTVLEHVFYSGTTNGAFAYPQSDNDTAILKVMVSGVGTGRLIVGDSVVPLVPPPQMRGGAATNILLLTVGRGVRKEVWFDKPDGLDVAIDSDDFMIGEMPTRHWAHGWMAFPHTDATAPCIHDFYAKGRMVTLVHGLEFPGLTAEWTSEESGVAITNVPPVSAAIYGNFPKSAARTVSYTLNHPNQLNSTAATFAQTLRFCPQFTDADEPTVGSGGGDDDEPEYGNCDCSWSGSCSCCSGEWCHCWRWDCPCNANQSPTLDDNDEEEEEAYTNIVNGVLSPLSYVLYLYRDNTQTENLPVPGDPPKRCCPCPEHWASNYVAKVAYSTRVAVKDAAGNDFDIAYEPCTVTVSGVSPSREFRDSTINFVTNGASYKRTDYTVLGVGFKSGDYRPALSNYNHLSSYFGYPVPVCTNLDDYANSIILKTDVLLSNGVVRVSLEDTSGDVALWLPEWWDNEYMWHPAELLLQAGVRTVRHFTIRQWRNVMRRYGQTRQLAVMVVSSRPSRCKVKFEFAASDGVGYVHDHAEQRITTVNPILLVDYNRDGTIDCTDVAWYLAGRIVYFWRNDDKWKDDDAFDLPLFNDVNSSDNVVNGRNDLINFLPVAVDVSPFASHWNPNAVYYRLETVSPPLRKTKLAFADIDWTQIGDAQLGNDDDIDGNSLTNAPVFKLESGTNLPPAFVSLSQSVRSTLFMEFPDIAKHQDLCLNIYSKSDNALLFSSKIELHVGNVTDMIGWQNLRDAAGGSGGMPTRLATPDWPAYEHEQGNVVFVHGYNMHEGDETKLWAQNVFKKLWWAGLDRGFIAVQWRGNEGQTLLELPLVGYVTPNYYGNVQNAFQTAPALSNALQTVQGPKWFIAHSLGNMLVSAAIQDYGMQYEKFFMLNAAIAMEAFDPTNGITQVSHDNMTPEAWTNYTDRVRATHWFELFPEGDGRRLLTWKGRFANVTNIVNFYSTQEEVVCNGDGRPKDIGREYSWYNQEYSKGSWTWMLHPNEGGWAFNSYYDTSLFSHMTPSDAAELTDAQLQQMPFFLDFSSPEMHASSNGAVIATNYLYRAEMLAYAIPAESYAVGANPILGMEEMSSYSISGKLYFNHNMAALFTSGIDDLPTNGEKAKYKHRDWQHSTFVQRSYKRVHQLFKIIDQHIKRSSQ